MPTRINSKGHGVYELNGPVCIGVPIDDNIEVNSIIMF